MTNANDNVIIGSDANPSADTGTSNQLCLDKMQQVKQIIGYS